MAHIALSQGKVALVDDEDVERLSLFSWAASRQGNKWYAVRQDSGSSVFMHQDLLLVPWGFEVDHKNGDGLDNRKCNQRQATRQQNAANGQAQRGRKYKGTYLDRGKYKASITVNYRSIHLGRFNNEVDAALAYDRAARDYFGEFACTNFPEVAHGKTNG